MTRQKKKRQTSERTKPRTRAFITLPDDRHVWNDRNSQSSVFFFGSSLRKIPRSKQSPPISHNDLNKDGAQLLLSN